MTRLGGRVVPSLLARNLRVTREFYQKRLGFRLSGAYPTRAEPAWIELTRDGVTLQFYRDPPRGTPDAPQLSGTLYLFPDSVDDLADELRERVAFEWGPETMDYGMREFAVRDPDGYLLAFTGPTERRTRGPLERAEDPSPDEEGRDVRDR